MKVLFDTSVVVAGTLAGHVHERRAQPWLAAAHEGLIEALISYHGLAETWATLSALPVEPRIPPASALRLVLRLRDRMRPCDLPWSVYERALQRCSDRGLRSGSVYDALHLLTAEHWGAAVLLTFNSKHFLRLAGPDSPRILVPSDPPGLGALAEMQSG